MLDAVGSLYNSLYNVINTQFSSQFGEIARGFFYKEDCEQELDSFPYCYLGQPWSTEVRLVGNPRIYEYSVYLPFTVITLATDKTDLYFDENSNTAPGAVELCHRVARYVFNNYPHGLPDRPADADWSVLNWTLGPMVHPTTPELTAAKYFDNPYMAGAMVAFIFRIRESG